MEDKKTFPFEVCATQSLMAQRIALKEIKNVKAEVKEIDEPWLNRCHWFKKYLKFTENGLTQRQVHLFNVNARNTTATASDYKLVQKLLDDVVDGLTPDIEMLKRCLARCASFNDCAYEKLISLFLTIGTLLHHAVEVFELINSPYDYIKEGYNIYSTINRIKPEHELHNFNTAVHYTNIMPTDIEYMEDINVKNSVLILADKMGKEFVSKFTAKLI